MRKCDLIEWAVLFGCGYVLIKLVQFVAYLVRVTP